MAKIVISYRRADTEAVTGRIRDRLVGHYGSESVFMDIDSIPFGIDFRDYIKDALNETDALIAVIGSNWTGPDETGPARIMEDTDPVRIEVEMALSRGIAVIPLLVDEAVMPEPSELPEGLKNLAFRNAAHVDSGRDFHLHMDRLIRSMDKLLGKVDAGRTPSGGEDGDADTDHGSWGFAGAPQITAAVVPRSKRAWVKWTLIAISIPLLLLGMLAVIGLLLPSRDEPQIAQTPAQPPAATSQALVQTPPSTAAVPDGPLQTAAAAPTCSSDAAVAFQDNFSPPAAGWDDTSPARYFADGQMVFRFTDPGLLSWLYRSLRYKNASVCATVKAPLEANKLDGVASGGIVFWATDYSNYYLARIYLNGTFQVYRRLSNEWIPVVARTRSDHIRSGLGAINDLQVTTKDSAATFYVNGQKLVEFRGQPPQEGGAVGLHGESEADRGGEWRFLGLTVVDHEMPAPKPVSTQARHAATTAIPCKASRDAAFADNFRSADGGWGEMTDTAYYDGGKLVLKPKPSRTRAVLYRSLRYNNPTLCASLRLPVNPLDSEVTSAGVAFWATSYSNFYQASIYPNGTFEIYRLFNDEWFPIKKRAPAPSIRREPEALNQVKVQLINNKAVLYINDARVVEFWGQPPPRGGAIGLFAQSDKQRQAEWRFEDIVVVD